MALPIFQRTVVNDNGDIIPNAQIEVRLESSGALATLYSDRDGVTPLSNPFFADSNGLARFYANPNEYRINATGNGQFIEWRYVVLIDSNDISIIGSNFTAVTSVADNMEDVQNAAENALLAAGSAATAAGYAEVLAYNFKPSVNPTIDLDFSQQDYSIYETPNGLTDKPLTDIATVTRASTATYFDATGALRTAGTNVPRINYNPKTGVCEGLLIEESRTNLFSYSEDFSNASWGKVGITQSFIPDGKFTSQVSTILETTDNSAHSFNKTLSGTVVGQNYTYSVIVKPTLGRDIFSLSMDSLPFGGTTQKAVFNTSNETVFGILGTVNQGIKDIGGGWCHLWIASEPTQGTQNITGRFYIRESEHIEVFAGDSTKGVYVANSQLEQGSFPTSYIPTTTTAVTRAADNVVRTLGDEFNSEEGVVYCEFESTYSSNDLSIINIGDNQSTRRCCLEWFNNSVRLRVIHSTGQFGGLLRSLKDGKNKFVLQWSRTGNELEIKTFLNGVIVDDRVDIIGDLPFNFLNIGSYATNAGTSNSNFYDVCNYPKALSQQECIALTSNGGV